MQVGPNREKLQVAETMGICTTAKFQCEMNEQSAEAKLTLSLGHRKKCCKLLPYQLFTETISLPNRTCASEVYVSHSGMCA